MARTSRTEAKSELGKRLREARIERHLSVAELARITKLSRKTLHYYEAGERIPAADILERLAIALGKSIEWLMARSPQVKDASGYKPYDIPVVGRGGAGRGQYSDDGFPVGEGWKNITRPYDVKDPNAFAVEVVGDSMTPAFNNRDIVVCAPNDRWYSGNYCVVKTEDGEHLIKRVNQQGDQLILQSEAPGHPPILIPLKKVAGVYKIVWQKRH